MLSRSQPRPPGGAAAPPQTRPSWSTQCRTLAALSGTLEEVEEEKLRSLSPPFRLLPGWKTDSQQNFLCAVRTGGSPCQTAKSIFNRPGGGRWLNARLPSEARTAFAFLNSPSAHYLQSPGVPSHLLPLKQGSLLYAVLGASQKALEQMVTTGISHVGDERGLQLFSTQLCRGSDVCGDKLTQAEKGRGARGDGEGTMKTRPQLSTYTFSIHHGGTVTQIWAAS